MPDLTSYNHALGIPAAQVSIGLQQQISLSNCVLWSRFTNKDLCELERDQSNHKWWFWYILCLWYICKWHVTTVTVESKWRQAKHIAMWHLTHNIMLPTTSLHTVTINILRIRYRLTPPHPHPQHPTTTEMRESNVTDEWNRLLSNSQNSSLFK